MDKLQTWLRSQITNGERELDTARHNGHNTGEVIARNRVAVLQEVLLQTQRQED